MKLLLDTHIFIWLANGDSRIPAAYRAAIESNENSLFLSSICVFEIATKYRLGKLKIAQPPEVWLQQIQQSYLVERLDLNCEHSVIAGALPLHHRDPFDRLLIAQAMIEQMTLLTTDSKFPAYGVSILPI